MPNLNEYNTDFATPEHDARTAYTYTKLPVAFQLFKFAAPSLSQCAPGGVKNQGAENNVFSDPP